MTGTAGVKEFQTGSLRPTSKKPGTIPLQKSAPSFGDLTQDGTSGIHSVLTVDSTKVGPML